MNPILITVRAIPAPGHEFRRRANRTWGRIPVAVKVVDEPKVVDEISPAQFAELQRDPHIAVSMAGGGDPQVPAIKAQLDEAHQDLAGARRALADLVEQYEMERTQAGKEAEVSARRIVELEALVEQLRADLAKGSRKRASTSAGVSE